MKKILLLQHAARLHPGTVDFACYIAKLLGSPVTGAFLEDDKQPALRRVAADAGLMGVSPGDRGGEPAVYTDPVVSHFSDACISRETAYAVHSGTYVSPDDLVKESRFADLLLLRPDISETVEERSSPTRFARFVLAHAACPVLLIPHSFIVPDEVVFTYDGTKASVFAIKQFTYLFSGAIAWKKVKLLLVNDFVEVPVMREWLEAHYSRVEIQYLEGGTTERLVDNLLPHENSIVVMGAYSRAAFSRLIKKSNADPLIDLLLSPVFIAHGL